MTFGKEHSSQPKAKGMPQVSRRMASLCFSLRLNALCREACDPAWERSPCSAAAHFHVVQVQPRVVIVQVQDDSDGEAVRSLGEVNSAHEMNSPDDHFAGRARSLCAGLQVATKLAGEIPSQAGSRLDDQLDD